MSYTDSTILWGATLDGVSNILPTYENTINIAQVNANLETVSGLVLSRVASIADIPPPLVTLAARVVETGAAGLTEQQNFPEQSTSDTSLGQVLWRTYLSLLEQLVAGVEALGGSPNVMERPAFTFPPPSMLPYQAF